MLQLPIYKPPVNPDMFYSDEVVASFMAIKPELAWILVALIGIFFAVISFVLSYHWKNFGLEKLVMAKTALIYFSVSSALFVVMIISLAVYFNSL